jgi:3-phenylpropionate/trans-cinnamate dioxygenase ferredoxin reductase subunit
MRKICKVSFNEQAFLANCGDLLLDSAIMNGVELQHDCRSGVCGACRVRLVDGRVFGGIEAGSDMIHACQARVVSDLTLAIEPVPDAVSVSARVSDLVPLAPDVMGVSLELPRPLNHLPGQYCKLQFRGFPERCYSPSYPLEGAPNEHVLHFHIRRFPDGIVSSALGKEIRVGHRVRLTGPFGSAFFRPNHSGRIVLVASGTGFAPMWSIAVAAIMEQPKRELMFLVGARKLRSFYMHAALCRLALFPNVTIIPMVSERQNVSSAIRTGRPTDHLPALWPDDVVYASGAPTMTDAVARIARTSGATCYTDPFVADAKARVPAGLMGRLFARRVA